MRKKALARFLYLLILSLLSGQPHVALGTIVSCNVLRKKTGQMVVIYGDKHLYHPVESKQSTLIVQNIENLLDSGFKTAILYEGIHYAPEILDTFCTLNTETPFWKITKYFSHSSTQLKIATSSLKIVDIDNRIHLDNYPYFIMKLNIDLANQEPHAIEIYQRLLTKIDKGKFSTYKSLTIVDLCKEFWTDFLQVYNNLKNLYSSEENASMLSHHHVHTQLENLDELIQFLERTITKHGFEILAIEKVLQRIKQESVIMQDLNSYAHIITHDTFDKQIMFVGQDHAERLKKWLTDSGSFDALYAYTFEQFLYTDDIASSNIDQENFNIINEKLDLITSAHAFYRKECLDHQTKETFLRLIKEIEDEIANMNNNVDRWYLYSLEDMVEEMKELTTISSEIVPLYQKRLRGIKKDFEVDHYQPNPGSLNQHLSCPSFFEHQRAICFNISNHRSCLSNHSTFLKLNN